MIFAQVTWIDTVDSSGWDKPEDVEVMTVEQWGFIVSEYNLQLKLADTWSDGDFFGVTAIPKGCIRKIQHVVAVNDPSQLPVPPE